MYQIKGLGNISDVELEYELQNGAKFVCYQYCVSIIIMTFREPSSIYFIRSQESRFTKGLPYTLLSFLAGWWGIPWGPIYTIGVLGSNLTGGRDVTDEIVDAMLAAPEPEEQEMARVTQNE